MVEAESTRGPFYTATAMMTQTFFKYGLEATLVHTIVVGNA